MSARISGVKNFVSQKIPFVRGFPFSHVQSASENGSIFFFSWVVEGVLTEVLKSCFGPMAAAMLVDIELGTAPAGGLVSIADGALATGFAAAVIPPETLVPGSVPFSPTTADSAAGFASFDSKSATRFFSCSTRSSSQRSRSVSPVSALFAVTAFGADGFESFPALVSSARPKSQTLRLTIMLNPNANPLLTHLRMASLLPDFGQRICFRNDAYPAPLNAR